MTISQIQRHTNYII